MTTHCVQIEHGVGCVLIQKISDVFLQWDHAGEKRFFGFNLLISLKKPLVNADPLQGFLSSTRAFALSY